MAGRHRDIVHTMPHKIRLKNLQDTTEFDGGVTVGNGKRVETKTVRDLLETLRDQYSNTLHDATISEVTYLLKGQYNLLSLMAMEEKGWELHNNKEAIQMTKGNMEIKFDIKIPTKCLFAMLRQKMPQWKGQ